MLFKNKKKVPAAWLVCLFFVLYTMNIIKTRKRPANDPVTKRAKNFPSPAESPQSEFLKQKLTETSTYLWVSVWFRFQTRSAHRN